MSLCMDYRYRKDCSCPNQLICMKSAIFLEFTRSIQASIMSSHVQVMGMSKNVPKLHSSAYVNRVWTGVDMYHMHCIYMNWNIENHNTYIYRTYRPSVCTVPVDPNPSSCEQATFAASALKPSEHTWVHSPSNCIWSLPAVELPLINLTLPRSLSLLFTTNFIDEW